MSGLVNWVGRLEPIWHTNQPHLFFYLMAGWGLVVGYSEPAMHMLLAVFSLSAIFLFHYMARCLAPAAANWLTAMFALSPAFLVEQNMMVDVPLVATWLLFYVPLITAHQSDRQSRRFLISGLGCSLAILIKYSSLVLLCAMALQIVVERRWRQAWTVLLPLATLLLWSWFNWHDYGGVHILDRQVEHYAGGRVAHLRLMLLGWLAALGAVFPLGVVAIAEGARRRSIAILAYVAATLLLMTAVAGVACDRIADVTVDSWLARAFKLNAIAMLVALWPHGMTLMRGVMRKQGRFSPDPVRTALAAWLVGCAVFYIALSPFIAVRHLLLVVSPVLLLFAMRQPSLLPIRARRWSLGLVVLVSGALSVADWRWADFSRQEATRIADIRHPGQRVFMAGHWGWQWYGAQQGFEELDVGRTQFRPGDLVVQGLDWGEYMFKPSTEFALIHRDTRPVSSWPLFCTERGAGFYSSSAGMPPWTLSRRCGNGFDVFIATEGGRQRQPPGQYRPHTKRDDST